MNWYGWQTLTADAISLGRIGVDITAQALDRSNDGEHVNTITAPTGTVGLLTMPLQLAPSFSVNRTGFDVILAGEF